MNASRSAFPDSASQSKQLYERARQVMPGGNTRHTVFFEPYPLYAASGVGCRVTDVDGAERIDCVNNYSSLIHGHQHAATVSALRAQIATLGAVGMPTESEIRLAEHLCRRYPAVESVRFLNSGTEAVMLAIKTARAYTGKTKIAKIEGAYHGFYDVAEISQQPSAHVWGPATHPRSVPFSPGTPRAVCEDVIVLPFNDVSSARRILWEHAHEISGVLIDVLPSRLSYLSMSDDYLSMLQDFVRRAEALLILDEVYSLRLHTAGAHGKRGISADLVAMGKIIGGGLPVGALGGSGNVMALFDPESPALVPHGGTYNANPLTMAAGLATMEALTGHEINRINKLGEEFRRALRDAARSAEINAQIYGQGSLSCIRFAPRRADNFRELQSLPDDTRRMRAFFHFMLNHGVFCSAEGHFIFSTAMQESDVESIVRAAAEGFRYLTRLGPPG